MSQNLLEILIKASSGQARAELEKLNATLTGTGKAAEGSGMNLQNMLLAVGGVTGVLYGLRAGYEQTVGVTMDYAEQVRDLGRNLGTTAEEASALLQIADDLKIDTGTLEVSFKAALKQGILPTVDGLKSLAAEYQAIPDPAARAQFALEKFGKSGLEMQKVLELTPGQIDEMVRSAEEAGLIMSGPAVESAKQYRDALDDLNDTMMGLKVTGGNVLIPYLTQAANATNILITGTNQINNTLKDHSSQMVSTTSDYEKYSAELDRAAKSAGRVVDAEGNLRVANSGVYGGMGDIIQSNYKLSEAEFERERATRAAAEAAEHSEKIQGTLNDALGESVDVAGAAENQINKLYLSLLEYEKQISGIGKTTGEVISGLNTGLGGQIEGKLKQVDFAKVGGVDLQREAEEIERAFSQGVIDMPTYEKKLQEVYVATQAAMVKMGDLTKGEAGKNISDALAVPYQEGVDRVRELLKNPVNVDDIFIGVDLVAEKMNPFVWAVDDLGKGLGDVVDPLGKLGENTGAVGTAASDATQPVKDTMEALTNKKDALSQVNFILGGIVTLQEMLKSKSVDYMINVQVKGPIGALGLGGGSLDFANVFVTPGGGIQGGFTWQHSNTLGPTKPPGGASGLNMIVPPGYPDDSFYFRASSYEQVEITPPGRRGRGGGGGGMLVVQNFYSTGGAAIGMSRVESMKNKRHNRTMGVE